MEGTNIATTIGRRCRLLSPVRDRQGLNRFNERPRILSELLNLGRHMYLVQFDDRSTTLLFAHEVIIE